ncbi:MAG: hypothetical protein LLF76_02920 [Planctomycetaceae bacterium]|nr:hypothetical protein [Planctomycetaceae bacterium]
MELTQEAIGVKLIKFQPMTRSDYNRYRSWQMPENENEYDDGYLVRYEDGYESWSPKDAFESAYLPYTARVPFMRPGTARLRPVRCDRIEVACLDEPGPGGACHHYTIRDEHCNVSQDLYFQYGPVSQGVDGIQNEDLLAVLIDRLEGFQSGSHACQENHNALLACKSALSWLDKRTADRRARGIEGTNAK